MQTASLTVSISNIKAIVGGSFFAIHGYKKANGELTSFNAQLNVKRNLKGGTWNGTPGIHTLVHKPCHYKGEKAQTYNGYRTLKNDSLVGCILKAHGKTYQIVS